MKNNFLKIFILIIFILIVILFYSNKKNYHKNSSKKELKTIIFNPVSKTITLTPGLSPLIKNNKISLIKIIDGDTIEASIGGINEKIRLIGVNTPEINDNRESVRCFAREAKEFTEKLLNQSKFNLEHDLSQPDRDKYNRLLRYIILEDGKNLAKIIIEEGYGYEYTYQIPYKYQQEFKEAQKTAQNNQRGLWNPDHKCNQFLDNNKKNSQKNEVEIKCNIKKSCSQMSTCDEAYFYLKNCGLNYLDNDKDGIPCENVCLKN